MILESILTAFKKLIFSLLSFIDLPNASDYGNGFSKAFELIPEILDSCKSIIDLVFPWEIVVFAIPIVIVISNFDKLYHFIMWIARKIPMLNIK